MRVYLDVSCYNRPFDDQTQFRVRLETEAIRFVMEQQDTRGWQLIASEVTLFEVSAIQDPDRREDVLALLPDSGTFIKLTTVARRRALELEALGIKPADALHVAAAEVGRADVFLTCDDKLLRAARRHASVIRVAVINPLDWMNARKANDDAR